MLEVRNLTKVYNSGKQAFTALAGVDINFGSRGLVVVLGKSGCGKSTLLNIIGGLDSPTTGEVIINGRSTATFKRADFDAYRNTFVGIVFQEFNLIDDISVFDNINMTMKLQEKNADVNTVDEALAMVGLANLGYRKPTELSGGQRQRVALARALLKKPEIILADEPTGALDSVTSEEVFETLKRIAQTKLVIVVTHNRELALSYADRIISIVDGKIVGDRIRESETGDGVKELEGGIIEVGAGGKVTKELINARLKKGETNYIGLSHEKDRIALAYPETVDGFYETQDAAAYKKTEDGDIKKDDKEFKLSKGGLSFKDSVKLAREGIKRAKKRYRFLAVVMSICFTMFSLALIVGMVSLPSIVAKSAFESTAQPLVVVGYVPRGDYYSSREKMDENAMHNARNIMGSQGAGATLVYTSPVFGDADPDIYNDSDGTYNADSYYISDSYDFKRFNNVIDCDDITELGLKVVYGSARCESYEEIIVSDFAAYVMSRRGIVGYDADGEFGLHYFDDIAKLVGCRIQLYETGKYYKIVGLFETDYENYKRVLGMSDFDSSKQGLEAAISANRNFHYCTMIGKVGFGAVLSNDKGNSGKRGNFSVEFDNRGSMSNIDMRTASYNREVFEKSMLWSAYGDKNDEAPEKLAENEIIVPFYEFVNIASIYDYDGLESILTHMNFKEAVTATHRMQLRKNWEEFGEPYTVKIVGIMYPYGEGTDSIVMSEEIISSMAEPEGSYDIMYFNRGLSRNALEGKFSDLKKSKYIFGSATADMESLRYFDEVIVTMGKVFLYIAIVLLVLGFLITFNYMTASIRFRTKEIAVYRVIGAKTFDVSKMFLCEGGFIVIITSVVAIAASFFISLILNSAMNGVLSVLGLTASLVNFNWLIEPLVIILGSALTVFLSSIIPIMRVCGKRPVEAVKLI